MKEVISLEDYLDRKIASEPHEVSELICVRCFYRYIGVYHDNSLLRNMICPKCGQAGAIIKTGQSLQKGDGSYVTGV